ncbi:MAG: DNA segregation ATPase FtsK [Idiomarinaceae bacterium HL-53]|nr:MAG: DNA segregation ATPase FtsK [Idiomarinaceae bacterium HL-53]CUS49051.1 DNA segregation ATPase FtsK/SpoIIIE, S-DNA-T family [Idiomarinaceae bacterium HL-53]
MTGIQRLLEAGLILVSAISIFLLTALLTFDPADPGWSQAGYTQSIQNAAGPIGAWFADVLLFVFGVTAFAIPFFFMLAGYFVFYRPRELTEIDFLTLGLRLVGVVLVISAATGLFSIQLDPVYSFSAGGVFGDVLVDAMVPYFNVPGTLLLFITFALTGVTLMTGLSWLRVIDGIGQGVILSAAWLLRQIQRLRDATRDEKTIQIENEQRASRARAFQAFDISVWFHGALKRIAFWKKTHGDQTDDEKDTQTEDVAEEETPWHDVRREPVIQLEPTITSDEPDLVIEDEVRIEPRAQEVQDVPEGEESQDDDDTPYPSLQRAVDPLPSLALLDRPNQAENPLSQDELDQISRTVESVLKDFGVDVQVAGVQPGPVITRFELDLAPGVKVSKISNLAKDIARSLSAIAVRVVEVIPGKSFVGLELPNKHREIVQLHEVLACEAFQNSASPLTMVLGKDIAGKPVVVDLAKMPHLLVAGTTGSGKSVGVNVMILSLLYKSQPDDVRLIMIDPKMLELSVYEGIPHLLAEVVTDMKDAANALRWCVGEMERRYKLMSALGVRNIKGYNTKVLEAIENGTPIKDPLWKPGDSMDIEAPALGKLPYIVVVVDEFADMMMIVGKKVEELIARIAQKARAAGIHLVLATQRPSVDVITGLIKANIPTRIAFQVSSKIDSRTILDQPGADQLLGQGDMLYLPPGSGVPTRVHGAFVDDHEVHAVVADWKARGKPNYLEEILNGDASEDMLLPGESAEEDAESDPLYDEAVAFVTEKGRVSVSSVQRQFRIGYNRAARIVEQMEVSGVVTPAGPGGAREVLAPRAPRDY